MDVESWLGVEGGGVVVGGWWPPSAMAGLRLRLQARLREARCYDVCRYESPLGSLRVEGWGLGVGG